jgi:hypothetical protein
LIDIGCASVQLDGMTRDHVREWLRAARVNVSHTDRIYELTRGYPVLVEGLIAHLRAGQAIEQYSAPDVFVKVLDAALLRLSLSPTANAASRRLSAFVEPIGNDRIAEYLNMTQVEWGTARAALEHERILSVKHGNQPWFHEMRRNHLWNGVMDEGERDEVGEAAFDVLLDEHRQRGGGIDTGLAVPIASLAPLARGRLQSNPRLAAAVQFGRDELAIVPLWN